MSKKKEFYENQYAGGETKGVWWYQLLVPWVKTREDMAFEIISKYNGEKNSYLDLGCGEGDLVTRLEPQFEKLVGNDIAESRLKIAVKKNKSKRISFSYCDLDKKVLHKANSFDVITCLTVLEYTFDPYFVMNEINRVLKPGGILILSVPNLAFLPERLKLLFGKLPSWPDAPGWQGGRLHNFTCKSLEKLGAKTSFKLMSVSGSGVLQPIRAFWPSMLCGDCIATFKKN